jgi:phosphoribosylaminoimidazole-succinocarboxamide synthase
VKLEHPRYEFGAVEGLEIALIELLLKDEQLKVPLLSPQSRNDQVRSGDRSAAFDSWALVISRVNGSRM